MNYYAHTAEDENGKRLPECQWQPLSEHLRNVAGLAKEFGRPLGLALEAEIAGLLHDLGKYQPPFQQYLVHGHPRTRHAIIGAAAVAAHSPRLANVIASHHGGLNNWDELSPQLNEVWHEKREELLDYLAAMGKETSATLPKVPAPEQDDPVLTELRLRLLFSALVDADYLDTEAFYLSIEGKASLRGGQTKLADMAVRLSEHMTNLQRGSKATSLNELRQRINQVCLEVGKSAKAGIFSLTVPTGGGKTLASASFALNHALQNGFERIIYVLPYTSIIEQNAWLFADIFGSESVLEHHSLADWTNAHERDEDVANWRKKLAAENWDVPFIVTTNVQFFESLLSHRASACRKLHRLLNSVIIFDECQTFPPDLLTPTLERLKALVALGRTTLVFCTATQPAFRRQNGFPEGFDNIAEVIPEDWKLHQREEFRRTKCVFRREPIPLPAFCDELRTQERALVVLNTRRQAWEVFSAIQAEGVFHLSTLMCPAHRQQVLAQIRTRLSRDGARCVVISTQLIEAGVDLDFPRVYRALGPLDSIIQAAGRCNREGRLPHAGEVIVFRPQGDAIPRGAYRKGTEISQGMLPEHLDGNFAPDTIHSYFESLYALSNRDKHNFHRLCTDQCYRQIGELYSWIESDTQAVLTDYSDLGKRLQAEVCENEYRPVTRQQVRKMAHFCINLRKSYVEEELISSPKLIRLPNGLVLTQESYDSERGYRHFEACDLLLC